eukprot:TRINITY_DN7657_c0_g1_i8.p1 TRINITY_DN7657_c0_g1~~TRINITY_DN7657_c0_g1_i8.p1  ORF type:complete len:559 (+),score=105.13 TRINITY_DN7657_c0_g1_i8:29-1705(+)
MSRKVDGVWRCPNPDCDTFVKGPVCKKCDTDYDTYLAVREMKDKRNNDRSQEKAQWRQDAKDMSRKDSKEKRKIPEKKSSSQKEGTREYSGHREGTREGYGEGEGRGWHGGRERVWGWGRTEEQSSHNFGKQGYEVGGRKYEGKKRNDGDGFHGYRGGWQRGGRRDYGGGRNVWYDHDDSNRPYKGYNGGIKGNRRNNGGYNGRREGCDSYGPRWGTYEARRGGSRGSGHRRQEQRDNKRTVDVAEKRSDASRKNPLLEDDEKPDQEKLIKGIFEQIGTELNDRCFRKEKITKISKEICEESRRIVLQVQRWHGSPPEDRAVILKDIDSRLEDVIAHLWPQVALEIEDQEDWKYLTCYQEAIQKWVGACGIYEFLTKGVTLPTLENLRKKLVFTRSDLDTFEASTEEKKLVSDVDPETEPQLFAFVTRNFSFCPRIGQADQKKIREILNKGGELKVEIPMIDYFLGLNNLTGELLELMTPNEHPEFYLKVRDLLQGICRGFYEFARTEGHAQYLVKLRQSLEIAEQICCQLPSVCMESSPSNSKLGRLVDELAIINLN